MPQISTSLLSPSQIRAGRALLNWTQEQLAKEAAVGIGTVRDYENERRANIVGALRPIEHALNNGGVVFIDADDTGGAGVRLLGSLPDVLRWPTKRGDQGELTIRIDWKGSKFEVFLSDATLEDLAELGHEPNEPTYLRLIQEYRRAILKIASEKINAGRVTPDRRVHLSDAEIRGAFLHREPQTSE